MIIEENSLYDVMRQALWTAVALSAPLLTAALLVGLVIGLFQALTSIQEMTLTFVPKMGVMLIVFWVSMSFMTGTLRNFFDDTIIPLIEGR